MIRTPLARRTELRRGKPLKRKTWMKQRRATPRRSGRVRDPAFMAWVRRQLCAVRVDQPDPNRITPCSGRMEADHQGEHPYGRKSNDNETVPMCHGHHGDRTNDTGPFKNLTPEERLAWRERQIARTQAERSAQ